MENTNPKDAPIYPFPWDYAAEKGESDAYHKSLEVSAACAKAIDAAISGSNTSENHYDLKTAAASVTEQFGYERVNFVLSSIICDHLYDGRYSRENKEWAQDFAVSAPNSQIYCNSHPVVLDGFTSAARKAHVHELAQTVGKYEQSRHMARQNRMTYLNTDTGVFIPYESSSHKRLIARIGEIAEKQRAAAERRREKKPTLAEQLSEAQKQVKLSASRENGKKRETEI